VQTVSKGGGILLEHGFVRILANVIGTAAAEKRAILEAAHKAGVGYGDWARSVLLAAAGRGAGRDGGGG
jgi:hypothetical protein